MFGRVAQEAVRSKSMGKKFEERFAATANTQQQHGISANGNYRQFNNDFDESERVAQLCAG